MPTITATTLIKKIINIDETGFNSWEECLWGFCFFFERDAGILKFQLTYQEGWVVTSSNLNSKEQSFLKIIWTWQFDLWFFLHLWKSRAKDDILARSFGITFSDALGSASTLTVCPYEESQSYPWTTSKENLGEVTAFLILSYKPSRGATGFSQRGTGSEMLDS